MNPHHFPLNKNKDHHIDPRLIVMESVSVSVVGLCKINPDSEQSHFPLHLRDEGPSFNILRGKENVLGHGLQLRESEHDDDHSERVQFDFVVQLPPILPCSYSGHFVEYEYFARLLVSISATESAPISSRCRVPLYVLPLRTASNLVIPRLMTPKNLQERLSVFRKRRKMEEKHCWTIPSTPVIAEEPTFKIPTKHSTKIPPNHSLKTPPPAQPMDALSFAPSANEHGDKSYYLRRNSLTLNYRDSNSMHDVDGGDGPFDDELDFDLSSNRHHHQNQNRFRICLESHCVGTLLLSDTVFADGQCIEGYLSLFTPAIVRVALVHEERCGDAQRHLTHCCSQQQCCWFLPSFTFTLKIPNNAFKSFQSDLVESGWSLHFQFAISKRLLFDDDDTTLKAKGNGEELGYLNMGTDVWKLFESQNAKQQPKDIGNEPQIDKILKWQLPIIVTTVHNRLRCVTRSNAVVIKC